jgi:hypothetical protein
MAITRGQILRDPEITGTGSAGGKIRILDGDESHYIEIQSNTTIASNVTLVLPATAGSNNFFLRTDGTGVLSWADVTPSGQGNTGALQYNNAGSLAGANGLITDGTNLTVNAQGDIRFADSDSSNWIALQSPATVSTNQTYTLPASIGTAGQVLKIASGATSSAATLLWSDDLQGVGGGTPGGSDGQIQYNAAGVFAGDSGLTYNSGTSAVTVAGNLNAGNANVSGSYQIAGTNVLTSSTLGAGVTNSSLTSLGTLTALQVDNININGAVIATTTTNQTLTISANGTGDIFVTNELQLRSGSALTLQDNTNSGSVSFTAPASVTSPYTLTMPASIGTNDEVLVYSSTGTAKFVSNFRTLNYVIDGAGSVITTGSKGYVVVDFDCVVSSWTVVADVSGSIVVDVKKSTYAGFPTTATIAGSELPTLSSAQKNQDLSLSTWTTSITAGDVLEFVVDSASTVTRVTVSLKLVPA